MLADDEDILTEILLWVPAKSLIKFKLVCKRWFSIIKSHHFSQRHTLHHRRHLYHFRPKPSLLLCLSESTDYFHLQQGPHGEKLVPYHFSPALVQPIIRGFSKGLFLLQCHNAENPMEDCHIYNPTTKESKRISLNSNENYRCVVGLNLVFDPLESPHYKIVCVKTTRRRSSLLWRSCLFRCQIEVYESQTGDWNVCGEPFLAPGNMHFHRGIYWNGSLHWHGIFLDLHGSSISKHPEVLFPTDARTVKVCDYVESNDHLHYVAYFPNEKSVMVFELQSDYSEWSLKHHIDVGIFPGLVSVLSMIREEGEEDETLVVHEPGKIVAYRFNDNSVKEMIKFEDEAFYREQCIQFLSQDTFQYMDTLAPP